MSEITRIESLKASLQIAEKMDLREPQMIVDRAVMFDKFLSGEQDAPQAPKKRRGRPPTKDNSSG